MRCTNIFHKALNTTIHYASVHYEHFNNYNWSGITKLGFIEMYGTILHSISICIELDLIQTCCTMMIHYGRHDWKCLITFLRVKMFTFRALSTLLVTISVTYLLMLTSMWSLLDDSTVKLLPLATNIDQFW